MEESDGPHTTIRRMRYVCWTTTATDTRNMKYLLLSTATMASRRRLGVTFIRKLPVLSSDQTCLNCLVV